VTRQQRTKLTALLAELHVIACQLEDAPIIAEKNGRAHGCDGDRDSYSYQTGFLKSRAEGAARAIRHLITTVTDGAMT
jgi:hypothetical protein